MTFFQGDLILSAVHTSSFTCYKTLSSQSIYQSATVDVCLCTGSPDVVFDFGDYVLSSADKAMYENTLNITLNRSCIKDLKKNVLLYVCLTLF